jgi:hypothetical protein
MTQNKAKEFRVRVVAQGGAAYATNLDTGEEVFINAALASADELRVGDYIRAICVPNEKSEDVQWYARVIEVIE